MAKDNQKDKAAHSDITPQLQALYFALRASQEVKLNAADKQVIIAALDKQYPILAKQAAMAQAVPLKERTRRWGNYLFYGILIGAGVVMLLSWTGIM